MPDYGTARCDFPGGDARTMYITCQQSMGSNRQKEWLSTASQISYKEEKDRTTFAMNIDGAYRAAAGLAVWKRIISAGPEVVVIADSFKTNKPLVSLIQSFMTICAIDISQPAKIVFTTAKGNKVELRYGDGWDVRKETMALETEEEQGLKGYLGVVNLSQGL